MKRFKSEFAHSYATYSFGYCEYAEFENDDVLADVYGKGFLPYTGTPHVRKTLYMARSARLNLKHFTLNSENRRVAKRFDEKLTRHVSPVEQFEYTNENFLVFCTEYFEKRHGRGVMPRERLLTILEADFPLSIITYTNGQNRTVGYAFEVSDDTMGHYWYSFYDLTYAYQSLGMWIMIDCAREARKQGKRYYYLGTVYDEKALYKTNFDTLEFWNGNEWVNDNKLLRTLARHDKEHIFDHPDHWKESHRHF
ncbi:GNAT family N-acetyltransferase [Candidatus Wolfebacteria bacterium]|nr:GNAT family N-acetyltransferase [Candidatus Wolfebacteria bacterium]